MALTSPILRFSLEILHHALENYSMGTPRHRKVAVLNLAQAVELSIKAALVENNISIYEKGGRTLNTQEALASLAALWDVERIEGHARVELLVSERNEIQHRYGNVDDVSLDYHMETTLTVMRSILESEFDTVLDSWIRDNVAETIWTRVRFVDPGRPVGQGPSGAVMPERSATLDFVDGFARFERSVRAALVPFLDQGQRFAGSTLDLVIKTLSNAPHPPQELILTLPGVYRLRNQAIHGDRLPAEEDVRSALELLDEVLAVLSKDVPEEVIRTALDASLRGVRGTRIPRCPREVVGEPSTGASVEGPTGPPNSPAEAAG